MKSKAIVITLLIVSVAAAWSLYNSTSVAQQTTFTLAQEQHWNYRQCDNPMSEEALNQLGEQGWELVSVFEIDKGSFRAIMKKPAR